jgi:hypothetical protein
MSDFSDAAIGSCRIAASLGAGTLVGASHAATHYPLPGVPTMATYGKKAQAKVKKVMEERKKGTLRSGSGQKVTSRKQAIAIGLSEARKAGAKVPKRKSSKT